MNSELAVRNGGLFWRWKGFDRVCFGQFVLVFR